MDSSWFSKTSGGVFSYLYKHITGEEDDSPRPSSSLQVLSKANVWITDLPTNNYEPLEASHGTRRQDKKVGVSSFPPPFYVNKCIFFNVRRVKCFVLLRTSMFPVTILTNKFVAVFQFA